MVIGPKWSKRMAEKEHSQKTYVGKAFVQHELMVFSPGLKGWKGEKEEEGK